MALIAFFGGVFIFAFLFMFVKTKIREKNAGKILSEQEEFFSMIRSNVNGLIPATEGFDIVVAVGVNDNIASLKGYKKIQTGYGSLPTYIVCYRNDEVYITSVEHPSKKSMTPDANFIVHFTVDDVEKVNFGMMGKVELFFKESKNFIVMNVTDLAIAGMEQKEQCQKFKDYMKTFAAKVS